MKIFALPLPKYSKILDINKKIQQTNLLTEGLTY